MENDLSVGKRTKFSVFDAALATTLFILFNFLFSFVYGSIPPSVRANDVVYFIASFLVEALFAVVAFLVAFVRKIDIKKAANMDKKISGKMVGLTFLISLVCLFGFSDLTSVFLDFLSLCGYKSILGSFEFGNFGNYIGYVIAICVAPAICEELLFRGLVLSGFKDKGKKVAVIVSAILFTLMHGNAEQTIHQFIIGLVIGYIFIESGNLWLGVLVHFFNNFISITEAYILENILNGLTSSGAAELAAEAAPVTAVSLLSSLVFAVIFAAVAYLILKPLIRSLFHENERVNGTKQTETTATIVVDGQETAVDMTIDGEPAHETKIDGETLQTTKTEEKSGLFVASIVLFVISGAYLVVDWVLALLKGFGI